MRNNKSISIVFFSLTFIFIAVAMNYQPFFDWVFERHHNQWSWYIRPLFLIPFCYFAYKKSITGISITLFGLFTSMCWFSKPKVVSEQVLQFLQFEKEWLLSEWNTGKMMSVLAIPISLVSLAIAFWKRSLLVGLVVIVLMATGKVVWSIKNAGESGKSMLVPAAVGLIVCCVLIYFGYRKQNSIKR